ncbi:MAG: MurR/RpiR family transcriptional regulator [Desulfitobacteriaceae bacterium]
MVESDNPVAGGAMMSRLDIEEVIDLKFPTLSQGQKKVAAEIRRDLAGLAFLSAARIGNLAGVSEATVHRLASSLSFNSFSEMQEQMKANFIENRTIVRLRSSTDSRRGTAFHPDRVLATDIDNLRRTSGFAQSARIWEAAHLLETVDRIFVAGWKASIAVSGFLAYSLNFMLGKALLLQEGELAERVAYMAEDTLLIIVGFPRYSTITLKIAELARNVGAKIIVITDTPISPFCRFADVNLFAATASDGFLDSYTAPLALSNSLVQAVSHLQKERVLANLEKVEKGLKVFDKIL